MTVAGTSVGHSVTQVRGRGGGGGVDAAPPPRSRWAGGPAAQAGRAEERRGGLALQVGLLPGGDAPLHLTPGIADVLLGLTSPPARPTYGVGSDHCPHMRGWGAEMCPPKMCSSPDPCSRERDLIWEKSWWTEVKDLEGIPSWM